MGHTQDPPYLRSASGRMAHPAHLTPTLSPTDGDKDGAPAYLPRFGLPKRSPTPLMARDCSKSKSAAAPGLSDLCEEDGGARHRSAARCQGQTLCRGDRALQFIHYRAAAGWSAAGIAAMWRRFRRHHHRSCSGLIRDSRCGPPACREQESTTPLSVSAACCAEIPLHYEVIANEITRGVGQSAQETGVPHGFGVLDLRHAGAGNRSRGSEGGQQRFRGWMAAVEMACLRDTVAAHAQPLQRMAAR